MVKSLEALQEDFRRITPKSVQQWEAGKPVMPGGVMKGAYFQPPKPTYIDHARDCYVFDIDGNRYVDFSNHHTATILGHSHPAVVKALHEQVDRGVAFGSPTTLEKEVAEELVKRIPSVEKVRYTNSGTEASLNAVRVVRAVTGKPLIGKFEGAYHGSNDAGEFNIKPPTDESGPQEAPNTLATYDGMPEGGENNVVILPYNDVESVELILREHKDRLAAVLFDGRSTWYDISFDFTRFLRKITEELGILLVFDEVISFRSGYAGYQGVVGVEPDLTIFGKVVGGGLPVGAIGGKAAVMDILDTNEGPTGMYQSGNLRGQPLHPGGGAGHPSGAHTGGVRAPRRAPGQTDRPPRPDHGPLWDAVPGSSARGRRSACTSPRSPSGTTATPRRADDGMFARLILGLLVRGYYARDNMGFILSNPMTEKHVDGLAEAVGKVLHDE